MTKLISVANSKGEVTLYKVNNKLYTITQELEDCSSMSYSFETHMEVSMAFSEARERLMEGV